MGLFDFLKKKNTAPQPEPAPKPWPASEPAAPKPAPKPWPASEPAAPKPQPEPAPKPEPKPEPKPQPEPAAPESPNTGVLRMGVEYQMQYSPNDDSHTVEIHDTTGIFLHDDMFDFMLGKVDVAIFVLTEQEFALSKQASGLNNPAVQALVEKLMRERPRDRLRAAFTYDPATQKRMPLGFRHQVETMDDRAYKKYRTARAMERVRSLERLWLMFGSAFGGKYPAMDGQGYAFVFDEEAKAQANAKQNSALNLTVKAFDQQGFQDEVRRWYGLGVTRFRLNPGCPGVWGEIDRDAFLPDPKAKQWDYYGSSLNQLILRFTLARSVPTDKNFMAMAATFWSGICHSLSNTPLLVPVAFEGDGAGGDIEDRALHTSAGGAALLNRLALKKMTGAPVEGDRQVSVTADGKPAALYDTGLFWGGEGYQFATGKSGGKMQLRTMVGGGKTMLCAFTNLETFNAAFHGKGRVGVFTYDEILSYLDDSLAGSAARIEGLVINPMSVQLTLSREDLDRVAKERNEPPKIFGFR